MFLSISLILQCSNVSVTPLITFGFLSPIVWSAPRLLHRYSKIRDDMEQGSGQSQRYLYPMRKIPVGKLGTSVPPIQFGHCSMQW